ncbi:MAG: hypothetical protein V3V34_11700 [Kiloniellales bacterium]
MTTYEIIQTETGISLGVYEGATPEAAWAAMCLDAGYAEAQPRDAGIIVVEVD